MCQDRVVQEGLFVQTAAVPPGIRPRAGGAVATLGNWGAFFDVRAVVEGEDDEDRRVRGVAAHTKNRSLRDGEA
jgi:hypothetical protein